jgi:low affinity Fe/Cu permease
MDNTTLLLVVIAVVAVAAVLGWYFIQNRRRRALRERFGPEYERTVHSVGDPAKAEAVLDERVKRVERFDIKPLGPADRNRFADEWKRVQARFVDEPRQAVTDGDRLITEVMRTRGYPVERFEQRAADLSVHHPAVVEHYRAGRTLVVRHEQGNASTEDLRQAMVHFRALFFELVEGDAERNRRAS